MKKGLILTILLSLLIILTACQDNETNDVLFELIGDVELNLTVNTPYTESGFIAKNNKTDIGETVIVENDINPTVSGDYNVTYNLTVGDEIFTLTRLVRYRENGCMAISNTNLTECQITWSSYLHTIVKLKIYYEDDAYNDQASHIFDNVENIVAKYHKISDKYEAYDGVVNVNTINSNPTSLHILDQELFDLISFTVDHQDEVNNRFNLALGPVLSIWHDYREQCPPPYISTQCSIPLMTELEAANQYTNPSGITLDSDNLTITMLQNMSIDLGGVSKGYISDKIIDYLDSLNLSGYLLNNGNSNISIGGTHPTRDNEMFLLAITDPANQYGGYYATVYLSDGEQLVTSGDYQQYFEVDGDIYHHIINPITLMPDRNSRSVSIVTSQSAGLADLYSTALFTMSIEDGLAFVNSTTDLEAIWYDVEGNVHFSDNFEENYLGELQ